VHVVQDALVREVGVQGPEARDRVSAVMQKNWDRVQATLRKQGNRHSNASTAESRVALGHLPRLGWGEHIRKEIIIECGLQSQRDDSQGDSHQNDVPAHRIFVESSGGLIRAATSLVHGLAQ
jgi:hypothetical protein